MQSVERVAAILLGFTHGQDELGVTEIARMLELPKSVVHRTLDALVDSGLVARNPVTARYRLGPRTVELGLASIGTADLRALALPVMEEVTAKTQETVTLSYIVQSERVYVAQVEGPQTVRMTVRVGQRAPLYAGASGRAILAAMSPEDLKSYFERVPLRPLTGSTVGSREQLTDLLADVRSAGYAASFGERDPWAAAVAAPITTSTGQPIGSMSVCGPLARFQGPLVRFCGESVRDAARQVTEALAGDWSTEPESPVS